MHLCISGVAVTHSIHIYLYLYDGCVVFLVNMLTCIFEFDEFFSDDSPNLEHYTTSYESYDKGTSLFFLTCQTC